MDGVDPLTEEEIRVIKREAEEYGQYSNPKKLVLAMAVKLADDKFSDPSMRKVYSIYSYLVAGSELECSYQHVVDNLLPSLEEVGRAKVLRSPNSSTVKWTGSPLNSAVSFNHSQKIVAEVSILVAISMLAVAFTTSDPTFIHIAMYSFSVFVGGAATQLLQDVVPEPGKTRGEVFLSRLSRTYLAARRKVLGKLRGLKEFFSTTGVE